MNNIPNALFQLHVLSFDKYFKSDIKSVEFFQNQVKIALVDGDFSILTYKQLKEESDKLSS